MNPALGALLAGATFIALSPIFVRLSVEAGVGPTATAFWRVALAVPALWVLYWLKPRPRPRRYSGKWLLLLGAGLAFAGDLAFWHTSIQLTSVANSTLLANLASIFVTLAAWIFLRQRPTRVFLAGLGAALAGVTLLVHASLQFSPTGLAGDALGVVTAMFYAGYLLAASVSLLFQPVMAALFAWLLLAEPLGPLQVAGGAVVLIGIYLARRGSA